jgi:hypothetical protein
LRQPFRSHDRCCCLERQDCYRKCLEPKYAFECGSHEQLSKSEKRRSSLCAHGSGEGNVSSSWSAVKWLSYDPKDTTSLSQSSQAVACYTCNRLLAQSRLAEPSRGWLKVLSIRQL